MRGGRGGKERWQPGVRLCSQHTVSASSHCMYRKCNSWQTHCILVFIPKILIVPTRTLILSGSFWAIAVCNVMSISYNKIIIISQGHHSRTRGLPELQGDDVGLDPNLWFLPHLPTLSATGQMEISTNTIRKGSWAVQKSGKASSSYKIAFVLSAGEFERPAALAWKELTAFPSYWILSLKHQL